METLNQLPEITPVQPIQTLEPVKNKNIFKYLFFLSLVVILGIIIAFYFILNNKISKLNEEKDTKVVTQNVNQVTIQPTVEPTIKKTETDAKKVLTDLQTYIKTSAPILESDENFYGKWLVQDDLKILLKGFIFRLGKSNREGVGKYGNYSTLESITESSLQPLLSSLDNFFKSNEFIKDSKNNYRYGDLLTIGYAKNDLKCVTTITTNGDPFVEFFCGITDQNQLIWRKELSSIIGTETSNKGLFTYRVSSLSGNYAHGFVQSDNASGSEWIAVKINGVWKIVDSTNGYIKFNCKIIEQYQIPKEIYNECE